MNVYEIHETCHELGVWGLAFFEFVLEFFDRV
jgi:hypothetical protein